MAQTLQLELWQSGAAQDQDAASAVNQLLENASLIIGNLDSVLKFDVSTAHYSLLLGNERVALKDGTILKGEHFIIKVKTFSAAALENNPIAETHITAETSQATENVFVNAYSELNKVTHANNTVYGDLFSSTKDENINNELAFLQKDNSASFSDLKLDRPKPNCPADILCEADPASLLTQYFTAPKVKTTSNPPIEVQNSNDKAELFDIAVTGNILHALDLNPKPDFYYPETTSLMNIPVKNRAAVSYRDEETEKRANMVSSNGKENSTTRLKNLKKFWQQLITPTSGE